MKSMFILYPFLFLENLYIICEFRYTVHELISFDRPAIWPWRWLYGYQLYDMEIYLFKERTG